MVKLPFLNGLFEDKTQFSDLMVKKSLSKKQLDVVAELLKNNPEQMKVFQDIYEEYEKLLKLNLSFWKCLKN